MSKIRVAINGFGRIGRMTTRVLLAKKNIELVAINDLTDNKTLAHLFKYDSIHGRYKGTVLANDHHLIIDGNSIHSLSERDPEKLPWKELKIDVVLECTGKFTDLSGAQLHQKAGARKVVLSAPAKGDENVKTIVLGVNEADLNS